MSDSTCTWHLNDFARGCITGGVSALLVCGLLWVLALYLVSLRFDATVLLRGRR